MRIKASLLVAAVLSTVAAAPSLAASTPPPPSAPIKMLPPENVANPGTVCPPSTATQVLAWDGKTSIKCVPKIQVTPGGDLIVGGGASVAGGVQVGNTNAACIPAIAGSLRWTGAQLEVCNGNAWITALGGANCGNVPNASVCSSWFGNGVGSQSITLYQCVNGSLKEIAQFWFNMFMAPKELGYGWHFCN
jgi:hypothetical protein